jgi:AraC family transcriptional regulator of adaptative response / DNA-3-methyladenine glycosylase II
MTQSATELQDDSRYLALKARDARFDGLFFTGVSSTGIYCRPVCRVRLPKRENCRFFDQAAQAEGAGFRPCLRCRPELAPRAPGYARADGAKVWSTQDASGILALQAAQLIDAPENSGRATPSMAQLARRLGVSDRHLRRIFEAHFGVSPLQYLQTKRLLCAKQLLTDTPLPVTEVAALSGFASVRRFNAAFVQHYALQPNQLRTGKRSGATSAPGLLVKLSYRPPYDVPALLRFFALRQIGGVEDVGLEAKLPRLSRTLALELHGKRYSGWFSASFDNAAQRVELRVSDSLREVLPVVMTKVRALLDLDADPQAINTQLHSSFPNGDGLRLPGCVDGFELAVRAVLGQQVTVAAARTLANRLVERFGEDVVTPLPGLSRLFPSATTLAAASGDALGQLGIVKQRQLAIRALASAVLEQNLQLHSGADVEATLKTLKTLPGIGDWTAQYIAMRALHWPDAFPAGDIALQHALGLRSVKGPAQAALACAQAWRPWRSYATIRAWARSNGNTP